MANNRNVYQQLYTVSVPKNELLDYIVYNQELNKKDYKIILMLLTELNGYSVSSNSKSDDPKNFTKIDTEQISSKLCIKESIVKKSIKKLIKEGIIEKGSTTNMKNGYRFTF